MGDPDNTPKKQEEEKHQLTKVDLLHHLITEGTIAYVYENTDKEQFVEVLLDWMLQVLKVDALYSKGENIYSINYKNKGGITNALGLNTGFRLFFIFDKGKIYFDIKDDKWFENPDSKFSLSKLVSDSHQAEIQQFIFDYLLNEVPGTEAALKIDGRNHFVEKLSAQKKIWFANHSSENEILLAFLAFSAIKDNGDSLDADNSLSWYLLISSEKSLIVAFDKREEAIEVISCDETEIVVNKELGRNTVSYKDIAFLTTRSNDDLFYQVQHINLLKPDEKIRETARINWIYKKKNEASNQFAIELKKRLVAQQGNPFDELSLLFMEYSEGNREEVFAAYTQDERLLDLLHEILNYAGTNEFLTKWIHGWEISYIDSVAINNILLKAVDDAVQANNILPFHRLVRDNFLKKNSDELNPVLFDLEFCDHLIKCGLGKEAKTILQKHLKQLPDESISDLLPSEDIDLTGLAAGQVIKVTILEILASLETEKNAIDYKCQIARLQPLVEERVDKLIEVSEPVVAAKGGELKLVMEPEGLKKRETNVTKAKYKQLDSKLLEKHVQHPASRKGGRFSNFQKWLASVKIPDYSMLKSYSEKLSASKHPLLNEVVTDIKYALNIEKLEVYISQGEKSVGINAFESDPMFLIVGGDHLDKESAHYLQPLELRFAIGVELAHLRFKHARITANDIWKGAIEKSYLMVDSVLSFVPAVGLLGKSIQGIGKLNSVSSFLQKTVKFGKASTKSKEILNTSEQVVKIYKSKFSKEKKQEDQEKEFLATFRLIQLTADRCAFIFTKDLTAAIRAMFLVSRDYYSELPVIEKYGLREFLLKKDEDGSFRHQELAIRLASLFSFYLSDDYEVAIKKVIG